MDFAALPPEINSGRMYSGAGAAPLLAAATAWDALSAELHTAAASYQSVITQLTSTAWSGPSATAMAAAMAPHISWLTTTATAAEHTAMQARATASAYETAFAMTVPPTVVTANRTQLATLVATNILGQNTPAILATEAHYAHMWAQDAIAMHSYAGTATTSSTLTPFTAPAAATPTLDASGLSLSSLPSLVTTPTAVDTVWVPTAFLLRTLVGPAITSAGLSPAAGAAAAEGELLSDGLGLGVRGPALAGVPVSAGVGQAGSLGSLSVPPGWATAAPATDTADPASPAPAAALPDAMKYLNMAMAAATGLAVAGTARLIGPKHGDTASAPTLPATRPPADTASELRELAEIIESGILTDEMLTELVGSGMLPDEALTN